MTDSTQENSPEQWLDHHGDALYAFAMMRVSNAATAEDLVQETLLAGLTAVQAFESRASVRTWLIGILKNKLIDHLRKSGREIGFAPGADDEGDLNGKFDVTGHWAEAPVDWGDPAALAENADLRAAMMRCIGHLPDKLRTPFVLREIDGLETDALIKVLDISSANNLWVMLSRGRERVRTCLERTWFGGGRR